MSGIINKIKDKVAEVTHKDPHATGTTTGTHTGAHTGVGGTHDPLHQSGTTHGTTAGTGLTGSHHTGAHTGVGGIHNPLHQSGTTHGTTTGTGLTGTHHTGSTTTAGPHDSNIANKLDPRVDSDLDGSHRTGVTGGGIGSTGYGSTGYSSTTNTGLGHTGSTNAGPHNSNIANKLDPRVDSDLDGSNRGGLTGAGSAAGGYGTHTTHGTHNTGLTGSHGTHNTGLTGSHDNTFGSGTHTNQGFATGGAHGGVGVGGGPGPAPNTAGPHSSDLLNKVDPRVDSNLDGSRTVGGNATYQTAGGASTTSPHDHIHSLDSPPDASRDPPSVLAAKLEAAGHGLNAPKMTDHGRRHSITTRESLDRMGPGHQ